MIFQPKLIPTSEVPSQTGADLKESTLPTQLPNKIEDFSIGINRKFQKDFKDLQEYLDHVLSEQNCEFSSTTDNEEKVFMAKAKAKEYFRNYASEAFRHFKTAFEENQLYHLLPSCFAGQVLEKIKEDLNVSLKQLTPKILESLTEKEKLEISPESKKIRQKGKKGKGKLDKRAVTILKNWLTGHFQDPYPSHEEKLMLAKETGLSFKQVQIWFTNVRGRAWKKTFNPEKFESQIQNKLLTEEQETENPSFCSPCFGNVQTTSIPTQIQPIQPIQPIQANLVFSRQLC